MFKTAKSIKGNSPKPQNPIMCHSCKNELQKLSKLFCEQQKLDPSVIDGCINKRLIESFATVCASSSLSLFLAGIYSAGLSDHSGERFFSLFWSSVLLDTDPSEPLRLQQFLDNEAIDQREEADAQADQVLLEGKGHCADSCTSIFDESCLDKQSPNDDTNEEAVIEEAFEYVVFLVTQLARVNLVKYLHEHE